MSSFFPKRLPDAESRLAQIEDYLARLGDSPINAAVEAQAEGLASSPQPDVTFVTNTFVSLLDTDVEGAEEGDLPVFIDGFWVAQNWTPASFGVGMSEASEFRFEVQEETSGPTTMTSYGAFSPDTLRLYFTQLCTPLSGLRGLHLQKKSDSTLPLGITLEWDTVQLWDTCAIDATTRDLVLAGDHSANSGAFADVFRWSQEQDSTVSESCKFAAGRMVGSPKDNTEFGLLDGGDDVTPLGGLRISYFSDDTTRHALVLRNRDGTSKRVGINFNDSWVLQLDPDADGGEDIAWQIGSTKHWTILSPGQVSQFYVDAGTTNLVYAYRLQHNTSGTSAAGFGVGMQYYGETNSGADAEIAAIGAVLTDTTNGSHAGYITLGAASAGAGVERVRLHGDGRAGVASGGANPLATGVEWNITKTAASAPSIKTYLQVLGVADTSLTASTEASDVIFNLARTVTFATGALTNQRAIRILSPTYAFAAASTLTNPSTLYIDSAPVAGANATFTNGPYAIFVDAGLVRFDGNGTHVLELPADATDPTAGGGAAVGRIPALIGGALRYIPYY